MLTSIRTSLSSFDGGGGGSMFMVMLMAWCQWLTPSRWTGEVLAPSKEKPFSLVISSLKEDCVDLYRYTDSCCQKEWAVASKREENQQRDGNCSKLPRRLVYLVNGIRVVVFISVVCWDNISISAHQPKTNHTETTLTKQSRRLVYSVNA
jgi:hypothetical protein